MKILVIHTKYRYKGGEDSVVSNEIKLLESKGAQVQLLQFSNQKNAFLNVLQLPFNYTAYSKTMKNISSFRPDVIHIHNLHFAGSPSVIYAIKKQRVPFVMTLHNYRLLCPSATLFANGKIFTDSVNKIWPFKAVTKGVYLHSVPLTLWLSLSMLTHQLLGTWKSISKFIALGEHSKQLFVDSKLKLNPDDIAIKPNFCYAPNREELKLKGYYYVYIGRLSDEKGLNTLLNAFVKNKLPLKIVGSGPMEEEVKNYSNKYININYLGSLAKENVYILLKNASALIFPSVWYETFGMSIIEAFSNGTPVIASKLGQMKNLITDKYNGLHFEAGNEEDLNEKVNFFENLSEQTMQVYRMNAHKTYEEKFTPEINAQALFSIYNSVIHTAKIS